MRCTLVLLVIAATVASCHDSESSNAVRAVPVSVEHVRSESDSESDFQRSAHYEVLSPARPASSQEGANEVVEIFWYGCPHCSAFEPHLESWLKKESPSDITLVRMPAIWNDVTRLHAQAYYTAQSLGIIDRMHGAMFAEIHQHSNELDTESKLIDFLGGFGIERRRVKEVWTSPEIEDSLSRARRLNRDYGMRNVPWIVVNGKYATDTVMAGGYEELTKLMTELLTAE